MFPCFVTAVTNGRIDYMGILCHGLRQSGITVTTELMNETPVFKWFNDNTQIVTTSIGVFAFEFSNAKDFSLWDIQTIIKVYPTFNI